MPVISPCTWNMTSTQLVTPTTSQLAAINSIQAMITSSTYWTVSNTGTTTAGYKYVEARPTNTSSVYKDYRVLFVERVNTTTNKSIMGSLAYSATNIMATFAPDGGSSWCTFTPANIETSSHVYAGTRYKYNATTWPWLTIATPYTAFWMYECDGQMWISHRGAATSYYLFQFGATWISARSTHVDYNEAGTEVGLPGMYQKTAAYNATSSLATTLLVSSNAVTAFWYNSAPSTKTFVISAAANSSGDNAPTSLQSQALYNTTSGTAIFKPLTFTTNTGVTADTSNFLGRGVFWSGNMATRTTVKDSTGTNILGYSWYPDDSAVASTNNTLMFINIP